MSLTPLQLCLLFSSALFCVGLIGALSRSNTILVLLGIAITLLTGSLVLQTVETHLVEAEGETLALAAVDIASKLDLLLAERYGDIQMLSHSQTFQGRDTAAMTRYLEWMQTAYPLYEWLGVTDAHGRIVEFITIDGPVSVVLEGGDVMAVQGAEHRYRPLTSQEWILRFGGPDGADLVATDTGRASEAWPVP